MNTAATPPAPKFIETLRFENGVPVAPEFHVARFLSTHARFFPHARPPAFPRIDALCVPATGRFKCRIVYGEKIESVEIFPYAPRRVRSLRIVHAEPFDYSAKFADRSAIERLLAEKRDADDIIICVGGRVCDTSFSNLAFLRGGKLFTPDTFLLAGTMRRRLIAAGRLTPIPIRATDIARFERVILINAMMPPEDDVGVPANAVFF